MTTNQTPPLPSERSFGLTMAVVFGLLGGWLGWRGSLSAPVIGILGAALLFLLAALLFPRPLRPLNIAWMRFGLLLNRIVSPIVMGVLFFVLLSPIALLMRWRGRDALHRRFDPSRSSYWTDRDPPGPEGSSFPRQY